MAKMPTEITVTIADFEPVKEFIGAAVDLARAVDGFFRFYEYRGDPGQMGIPEQAMRAALDRVLEVTDRPDPGITPASIDRAEFGLDS